MTPSPHVPKVAVLGAGSVGLPLLARLASPSWGEWCRLLGVAVRHTARQRNLPANVEVTADPHLLAEEADVLVELMGGLEPAASLMLSALSAGKRVVTANKAVLAERWEEFEPYLVQGRLYCEAAVMAGTPVIEPLATSLRATTPLELHAVLNGTTTYILSRLEAGEEFQPALVQAQQLGFAEADPTLDIGGIDAAHKLAILARLVFDPRLQWEDVFANTQGVAHLTPAIVREAMEDGGSVRLVGSIYPEAGRWRACVRTAYLPAGHPLASSRESGNVLVHRSRELGEVIIQGPGAGGAATASAVLSDVLRAVDGRPGPAPLPTPAAVPARRPAEDLGELLKA